MSQDEFLDHWMRIGTTHKVELKNSRSFNRALTGSKGIGRLSAQFLASEITLESTSTDSPDQTLVAIVDWRNVTRGQDLDTVEVLWETRSKAPEYPDGRPTGTIISMKGLKTSWNADSLTSLGRDVWILRSPFNRPRKLPSERIADDFFIDIDAPGIEGAREAFDNMRDRLFENWRAHIKATLDRGRHQGRASVNVEFKAGYPTGTKNATSFSESVQLPVRPNAQPEAPLIDRMKLDILVFKPEGRQMGGISVNEMRQYLAKFGSVSVYDGGFRLPYYGSGGDKTGQDWLNIALDQGRRLNASELLPDRLKTRTRYMQDLPAPGRLFGAVEIDTGHELTEAEKSNARPGEWLQIQSSRDRLHDNHAFLQLRDFVRFSLDFYANRHRMLSLRSVARRRDKEPASRKFRRVLTLLDRGRAEIPFAVYKEVKHEIRDALKASMVEEEQLDQRAALLAPLATAGVTALALSHELARERRFLDRTGEDLSRIAMTHSVPELNQIATKFDDLCSRIDAILELFAPLLAEEDKTATDRLRVLPLVDHASRSMSPLMPGVAFDLKEVSDSLWFPVGSFAEWSAILQNVLANAWNAMLDTNEMRVSFQAGRTPGGREWLHVSDTGKGLGIPLKQALDLFEPFERHLKIRSDNQSIAIGGQGLGLTITRMIAHRRAARVRFIKPKNGFSTTFEVSWGGATK